MKENMRNLAKLGLTGIIVGGSVTLGVNTVDSICKKIRAKRTEKQLIKLLQEIEESGRHDKKRR